MRLHTFIHNAKKIARPIDCILRTDRGVTDLVGLFGEENADGLLLDTANLPEEFFDLKSGIAGMVLQKFATYGVKAAIVIPPDYLRGRFKELSDEASRGNDFRIFVDVKAAERWLAST